MVLGGNKTNRNETAYGEGELFRSKGGIVFIFLIVAFGINNLYNEHTHRFAAIAISYGEKTGSRG